MGSVELQESADTRPVERRMVVGCQLCKVSLTCPEGVDEWGWARSAEVVAFKAEHLAHGAPNTVGHHFEYIEKT